VETATNDEPGGRHHERKSWSPVPIPMNAIASVRGRRVPTTTWADAGQAGASGGETWGQISSAD
jgi:hypothetical protein